MKARLPIPSHPLALALALALPLAACGDKGGGDGGRTASGQVLEGTISDAMLPLDTVTSQPPLQKIEPSASGTAAGRDAAAQEEEGEAPAEVTPAPAETTSAPAEE